MKKPSSVKSRPHLRAVAASAAAATETCADRCAVEVIHADSVRAARAALPSEPVQARLLSLFGLLSNATRLNLLVALRAAAATAKPELCVCDLMAVTGASQSMTSHQLGLMREAELVSARREGRLVFYRLLDGPVRHLLDDALTHARGARR